MSSYSDRQMRSPIEILKYLDEYYIHMLERPSMYSPSPVGMENTIQFIENLRAFILNDPQQSQLYNEYLLSLGYGARGCSHVEGVDDHRSKHDLVLLDKVTEVLRQFLKKEGRPLEIENMSGKSAICS